MERDPALVLEDWLNGAVGAAAARDIYGVVVDEAARCLDDAATRALREGTRKARVERAGKPLARRLAGPVALTVTDNLVVRIEADGPHHVCAKCDADIGPARDNYKDHCLMEVRPVSHAVPLSGDPHRYIDADPEFRQFFCPGCGALIENEIAVSTDPILRDITIDMDTRLSAAAE
jgi:hypothetical protein